jgi:PleD family two-component response regulator
MTAHPPAMSPEARGETQSAVVVLNRDLFFGVRIANALRARGYRVEIAPTPQRFAELLREIDPVLGIIDMAAVPDWKPLKEMASEPEIATPLLAFGPHKDIAAFRSAKEAGIDRVVSKGDFHRDMLGLVERYERRTPGN